MNSMNSSLNNDNTQNNYAAFIAIDWADLKHTFSLKVAGQGKKETGTLEQKPEIIGPWVANLRERFGGPAHRGRGGAVARSSDSRSAGL